MESSTLPQTEISEILSDLWKLSYQPLGCRNCGQAFLAPAGWTGKMCPHCLEGALEEQPARLRREPPELVLPFRREPGELSVVLKTFMRGVWFTPDDFSPARLQDRAIPNFWPMWLVDGTVNGAWQAELGFDYQVKSTQESYNSGGWQSRDVIETRILWEPRLGEIERRYCNLGAPAVSDEARLSGLIGSSPFEQAQPYQPALLKGAALRIPDLSPQETWPRVQTEFNQAAAGECQQAAGGQHLRNFKAQVHYDQLTWTQMLLPVYITYYLDDQGKRVPVMINGATGQFGGRRIASQRKGLRWAGVSLLVALALFVLALLTYAAARTAPNLAAFSPLLWLMGFLATVFAAGTAAWPLLWNQSHK